MKSKLSEHQFSNLLELIEKDYVLYVPYISDNGIFNLEKYHGKQGLALGKKTIIPFKKYLFPNGCRERDKKIAFFALPLCDVHAIHILLKKISHLTKIKREDLLIVGSDCERDENCFCEVMNGDRFLGFDLYLEQEKAGYKIVSGTENGLEYLHKLKLKNVGSTTFLKEEVKEPFAIEDIPNAIDDKELFKDFWLKIGNTCFACSACTAVCPLCFCSKQKICGEKLCYEWDSCFSKNFSEIQNRVDLRPTNSDKIYNWYHHKFVRSPHENETFLCTGCGRCIKACPADINIKNILSFFDKKIEEKLNEN